MHSQVAVALDDVLDLDLVVAQALPQVLDLHHLRLVVVPDDDRREERIRLRVEDHLVRLQVVLHPALDPYSLVAPRPTFLDPIHRVRFRRLLAIHPNYNLYYITEMIKSTKQVSLKIEPPNQKTLKRILFSLLLLRVAILPQPSQ